MSEITVTRTGRKMDMASSEFAVVYPDGHHACIWSPPWHEMDLEEEQAQAEAKAKELYQANLHRSGAHLIR